MEDDSRPDPIDVVMEIYGDWRNASATLEEAYRRWSSAPEPDRGLAFAAYRAALDREECASIVYADQCARVRTHLEAAGSRGHKAVVRK